MPFTAIRLGFNYANLKNTNTFKFIYLLEEELFTRLTINCSTKCVRRDHVSKLNNTKKKVVHLNGCQLISRITPKRKDNRKDEQKQG